MAIMEENKAQVSLKPVSVQKVSAIMRKAGFQRSERHTTAIKGWYNYTRGYVVGATYDYAKDPHTPNGAQVTYRHGDHHRNPSEEFLSSTLTAYRTALESAGLVVERKDDKLICTAIKEA